MSVSAVQNHLKHQDNASHSDTHVWQDETGRAYGRYFNATLTSVFQPVRALGSGDIVGYDGFARSYSNMDSGLYLWNLLDRAASDEESIALDRLCRTLHAINFYRQQESGGTALYVSVHARLLSGVEGNHGVTFRRVLNTLELPHENIVVQLPLVTPNQEWLLNYVSENYRRNGFRLALNAANAEQALDLLDCIRPDVIKVDAREIPDEALTLRLLRDTEKNDIRVIFKRVENDKTLESLQRLGAASGQTIYAQGFLWDLPQASLLAPCISNTLIA